MGTERNFFIVFNVYIVRKFGKFRQYIINKKDNYIYVYVYIYMIHLCTKPQNGPLAFYTLSKKKQELRFDVLDMGINI